MCDSRKLEVLDVSHNLLLELPGRSVTCLNLIQLSVLRPLKGPSYDCIILMRFPSAVIKESTTPLQTMRSLHSSEDENDSVYE